MGERESGSARETRLRDVGDGDVLTTVLERLVHAVEGVRREVVTLRAVVEARLDRALADAARRADAVEQSVDRKLHALQPATRAPVLALNGRRRNVAETLLRELREAGGPLRGSDLARAIGMQHSGVMQPLRVLEANGSIEQLADKRWQLKDVKGAGHVDERVKESGGDVVGGAAVVRFGRVG